jgi:hypothetical protein
MIILRVTDRHCVGLRQAPRAPTDPEWDATPIIGSSARIIRGLSGVGIGVAVLTAVLGLAVTVSVAFNDYKYATQSPGHLLPSPIFLTRRG